MHGYYVAFVFGIGYGLLMNVFWCRECKGMVSLVQNVSSSSFSFKKNWSILLIGSC